ncbi:PE family protein [Mycobacterium sp. pUA109]|uniref:PE family protein n=1 Tax=Mycobacterium sp. pUA109 TaxID=3238982 RepID=UPI00351BE187
MTIRKETLSKIAGNLREAGDSLAAQNAAAMAPTIGLPPAGADEVSALLATQFAVHAAAYQAVSAEARAIHEMAVRLLGASAAGPDTSPTPPEDTGEGPRPTEFAANG